MCTELAETCLYLPRLPFFLTFFSSPPPSHAYSCSVATDDPSRACHLTQIEQLEPFLGDKDKSGGEERETETDRKGK